MTLEKITYIKTLEDALIDILDGNSKPHDIEYFTGLSDERCEEISKLFATIMNNRIEARSMKYDIR